MLGKVAVAMWWDVADDVRAEWEEWHTVEHMPERLGIPGFLRGTRWTDGQGAYFVLYEAATLETVTTGPYLARLNDPTPWSRRMMPHHRNMVRSLCAVRCSYGEGVPAAVATVCFSGQPPELPRRRGITGAAYLEAQPMSGAQTTEQKIRGGADAAADKVVLVGGYDAKAVARAAGELSLPGAVRGHYGLSYSLARA
jgi:hypothetical protein